MVIDPVVSGASPSGQLSGHLSRRPSASAQTPMPTGVSHRTPAHPGCCAACSVCRRPSHTADPDLVRAAGEHRRTPPHRHPRRSHPGDGRLRPAAVQPLDLTPAAAQRTDSARAEPGRQQSGSAPRTSPRPGSRTRPRPRGFDTTAADPLPADVAAVLDWCIRTEQTQFTRRFAGLSRARFRKVADPEPALNHFVDHGFHPPGRTPAPNGGRASSAPFEVDPRAANPGGCLRTRRACDRFVVGPAATHAENSGDGPPGQCGGDHVPDAG